jgi:hypothetical protein
MHAAFASQVLWYAAGTLRQRTFTAHGSKPTHLRHNKLLQLMYD